MPRPISRAELARLAKVSGAAITKACGKELAAACDGGRVDLDHPSVAAYLARRGLKVPPQLAPEPPAPATDRARTKPPKRAPARPGAPPAPPPPGGAAVPPTDGAEPAEGKPKAVTIVSREVTDVSKVADMTIRQVVTTFGTVTAFKDWLQGLKLIASVHAQNVENARADGKLISRELVVTSFMSAFELMSRRLLNDASKTVARELYAAARSGIPIEEGEKTARRIISDQLRPVRDAVAKAIRKPDGEIT